MSDDLQNICLKSLWPRGCHPARMLGRFNEAAELSYAMAPDMGLSWERAPEEKAEAFDRRIAEAILVARQLPPLRGRPAPVEQMHADAPKIGRRANEPQHKGSKLANPPDAPAPRRASGQTRRAPRTADRERGSSPRRRPPHGRMSLGGTTPGPGWLFRL